MKRIKGITSRSAATSFNGPLDFAAVGHRFLSAGARYRQGGGGDGVGRRLRGRQAPGELHSQPAHKAVARTHGVNRLDGWRREAADDAPFSEQRARCTEGAYPPTAAPGEQRPGSLLRICFSRQCLRLGFIGDKCIDARSRLAAACSGAGLSTKGILNLPAISAAAVTAPRGSPAGRRRDLLQQRGFPPAQYLRHRARHWLSGLRR